MKVLLIGKQLVSYTSKKTGNLNEGLSLFYTAEKKGVEGQICDNFWIRKDSDLYAELSKLDLTKPIAANVVNEVLPGGMYPELTEFSVLKQ